MFKKLALLVLWFLITPIVLATSGFYLSSHDFNKKIMLLALKQSTAAPVQVSKHIDGQVLGVEINDMRPYLVAKLLKNTVLEPYSDYMVKVADKWEVDYKLIPAIAMKESQGGNKARAGSFNAWGFENGHTNFESWEAAINIVGKTLKERYVAKGLTTPEQIMAVYAPPQLLTGGKWARDINYFFSKMESL